MRDEWRADLRLKFEDLVDKFVVSGADHREVLKTARECIEELQKSRDLDPDPTEDGTGVDEPANDWPAAT